MAALSPSLEQRLPSKACCKQLSYFSQSDGAHEMIIATNPMQLRQLLQQWQHDYNATMAAAATTTMQQRQWQHATTMEITRLTQQRGNGSNDSNNAGTTMAAITTAQ